MTIPSTSRNLIPPVPSSESTLTFVPNETSHTSLTPLSSYGPRKAGLRSTTSEDKLTHKQSIPSRNIAHNEALLFQMLADPATPVSKILGFLYAHNPGHLGTLLKTLLRGRAHTTALNAVTHSLVLETTENVMHLVTFLRHAVSIAGLTTLEMNATFVQAVMGSQETSPGILAFLCAELYEANLLNLASLKDLALGTKLMQHDQACCELAPEFMRTQAHRSSHLGAANPGADTKPDSVYYVVCGMFGQLHAAGEGRPAFRDFTTMFDQIYFGASANLGANSTTEAFGEELLKLDVSSHQALLRIKSQSGLPERVRLFEDWCLQLGWRDSAEQPNTPEQTQFRDYFAAQCNLNP